MCGISVIAGAAGASSRDAIHRMVESLKHRGPDGDAAAGLAGCSIGHTRLSIIDLAGGRQPMTDATGRYTITFNGEIYNYRELRARLDHDGVLFATASDTEVILAGYGRYRERFLQDLRGMFAFAIWDAEQEALFAARDIFGEKPLYYSTLASGAIALASEIRALLASGLLAPRLDRGSVDAFLALGYVPPDRTVYENVQTVPPGHVLRWTKGTASIEPYWRPTLAPRHIDFPEAVGEVRRLLVQAVSRQMVADVPVGAFLSGGLDSSTIVALMQQVSREKVRTFSVGFGRTINELPYARAVATQYGTNHHDVDLGEPAVGPLLERMTEVYDEPFADSSHIPTFVISEFARRHVKVVLSGDGGDEIFGGYSRYISLSASQRVRGSLAEWMILRAVSKLMRERVRALHIRSVAVGLAARWPDLAMRCAMSQVNIRAAERRALWGGQAVSRGDVPGAWSALPPGPIEGMNRAFHFDLMCYLPGDILVKVDRAAMAHGLETRAPLLDRDLAEFVLSLPASFKVDRDRTKIVFRAACEDLWPPEVRRRGKQGFGAPYGEWMARPDVASIAARVFGRDSALRSLLPGVPAAPNPDYRSWTLLTLGLWLERHSCAW